jgi:TonB family protein
MLFRRLLETNARASYLLAAEGYVISVVAHAAIIGGTMMATRQVKPSDLASSFTPVSYFVPRDRIAGTRPKQERITFVSPDARGGSGSATVDDDATRFRKAREVEPGPGLEELSSQLASDESPAPAPSLDSVMTVLEVDSAAARYEDSAAPPYPPRLLEQRIEGTVGVQYVVDTTGLADTTSVVILSATHEDFANSVRSTLPAMRFRAAVMDGRKVRQLVQQLFAFRIDTTLLAQQKKRDKP